MRIMHMPLAVLGLVLGCGGGADRTAGREPGAAANQPQTDTIASASTAMADTARAGGLTWGPPPPGLPAGSRVVVVSGDPTKPGPFTIRVDMPPNYTIRPHYHPTSEELRLLDGTLHLGHGAKWDEQGMKLVAIDRSVTIGAKQPHFLHAASRVVLEVRSTGPFAITYVDPKDDPRTGSTP